MQTMSKQNILVVLVALLLEFRVVQNKEHP